MHIGARGAIVVAPGGAVWMFVMKMRKANVLLIYAF